VHASIVFGIKAAVVGDRLRSGAERMARLALPPAAQRGHCCGQANRDHRCPLGGGLAGAIFRRGAIKGRCRAS